MQKFFFFLSAIFFITGCSNSISNQQNIPPLTDGFVLSSERGWVLPVNSVPLSQELITTLGEANETAMNDFYALAESKFAADKRVLLWAKVSTADAESGGVICLSILDKANKLLESTEVLNTFESEGGRFFDVFNHAKDNRFSKARFVRNEGESDVLFRYEYSISEAGELKLEGEYLNRNAAENLRMAKEQRNLLITEAGLSFLGIGEPFERGEMPVIFEMKKDFADGSYKLLHNGKLTVQFYLVNDLVEDIRVFNGGFITEKNIRCGSTFSDLKKVQTPLTAHCRGDEGVWVKVKESERLEFQLDVPANIPCNSDDEIPLTAIPENVRISSIRVIAQ